MEFSGCPGSQQRAFGRVIHGQQQLHIVGLGRSVDHRMGPSFKGLYRTVDVCILGAYFYLLQGNAAAPCTIGEWLWQKTDGRTILIGLSI